MAIEAFYEAALDEASVGGDSFDAFPLADRRVALSVADASGKGLAAAERIAETRFALRAFLSEHDDSRQALFCLNNFVYATRDRDVDGICKFATMTLVVLDIASGNMECLCAGGEPPLVLRANGAVEAVSVCGPALGLFPNITYEASSSTFGSGDTVLLATDGITEARHFFPGYPRGSRGSAFLRTEGLARLVRQAWKVNERDSSGALPQIGRAIFEGACAFAGGAFHDDSCLLVGRCEVPER